VGFVVRKAVYIITSAIVLISLILIGMIFYNLINPKKVGITDKTININVMMTRPSSWKKIVNESLMSRNDLDIIDGSTATIPITAEILRQFYGYSDELVNMQGVVFHSTTHNAYLNLINKMSKSYNQSDLQLPISLIFVTAPSEEEEQLAKENSVELDMVPVAKDGFVFITHK